MGARRRIVVKVGSSLLVNEERLTLRYAFMHGLMNDIAVLRAEGAEVVLASSGAVALGYGSINMDAGDAGVLDKQAAAACGMPLLLNAYRNVALEHGFDIAQVLVTLEDMDQRRRFLNTKNTIERLFEHGVTPIVNENDTVTTEEIRVGDNDRLAASIAQMVQADQLVILTCIDGLYDRDPSLPGAELVETVEDVSAYLEVTRGVSTLGSGGMLTKMHAANMAQNAGCATHIGRGAMERPIQALLNGETRHTCCVAKGTPTSSWEIWLTNRLHQAGSLTVAAEAAAEIRGAGRGVSREHILKIHGDFQKGDVLHVYDESGAELAPGMTNFSSNETLLLARNLDQQPSELLGYKARPEIIRRENMVVLEDRHLAWDEPQDDVRIVMR